MSKNNNISFSFGFLSAYYGNKDVAANSHKDVVQLLLNRGANTKLKKKDGSTACRWNWAVDYIIPSCN